MILNKVRIFSNGSQYADWEASNCERCKKYTEFIDMAKITCPIQSALATACFGDGNISHEMAKRAGVTKENKNQYLWPCAEVEWTEDWKKEYTRKHQNDHEI